jgi:hypothetical protein
MALDPRLENILRQKWRHDNQPNGAKSFTIITFSKTPLSIMMNNATPSISTTHYAKCHLGQVSCFYTVRPSVIWVSVIMQNDVILSVVEPK